MSHINDRLYRMRLTAGEALYNGERNVRYGDLYGVLSKDRLAGRTKPKPTGNPFLCEFSCNRNIKKQLDKLLCVQIYYRKAEPP